MIYTLLIGVSFGVTEMIFLYGDYCYKQRQRITPSAVYITKRENKK